MIIELLLSALYGVFDLLTRAINIPQFPEEVYNALDRAKEYLQVGAGILSNYVNMQYILTIFMLLLAIDVGIAIYHFVLWVLKKIPMINMK